MACCGGLLLVPTGFEEARPADSVHAKALVLEADNDDLQRHAIVRTGTQFLQVELLAGPQKGTQLRAINQLMGKMELDEIYKPGEYVLVEYQTDAAVAYTRGHYRLGYEVLLIALFAVFLVAVAGWTGVKAFLSFAFAALAIWKLLIPLFLKGVDPLLVSMAIVAALTASVSFLVGGITRKGLATYLGAFSGLIFACVLAHVFAKGFHLHGAVRPFAETLLYSGFAHLDLNKIFICGIFIACSGAVMDLAMDICASMDEIKRKKPDIGFLEHTLSGLRVGRSVVGTMTTTLLLAYSGGYTAMLMYYVGQGTPLKQFFNLNLVAAEILNTLVGSFGLVAVAPFSALAAGVVYHANPASLRAARSRMAQISLNLRPRKNAATFTAATAKAPPRVSPDAEL